MRWSLWLVQIGLLVSGLRGNGVRVHDAPVAFREEPTVLDRYEWQRFRAIAEREDPGFAARVRAVERGSGPVSGPDDETPPGAHRGAAV